MGLFHNASRMVSCAMFTKVCLQKHKLWKFLDFSIIRSLFEAIFSQDVAKEGR